jgi:uncharacterized damage-inducible protein DinB
MIEQERIRWLIERIRDGYGWHGWDLAALLKDVTAAEAAAMAVAGSHTIWQIVLHVITWREIASDRMAGREVALPTKEQNWPVIRDDSEAVWAKVKMELEDSRSRFIDGLTRLPASRLEETVPGEPYTFVDMLYGVLHHDIYHAGQVAVIRNALRTRPTT